VKINADVKHTEQTLTIRPCKHTETHAKITTYDVRNPRPGL